MNPKNLIFLLLATLAFQTQYLHAQFAAFGQEKPKKGKPKSSFKSVQSNSYVDNSKTSKVIKLADKIISTLDLNESEAKSIHLFCEERAEKIERIKLNSDNSQQKIIDLE